MSTGLYALFAFHWFWRETKLANPIALVCVTVAERLSADLDTTQSVDDIPNTDVRSDTTHVDHGVHGQCGAGSIDTVNAENAGAISVLPDSPAVVNEGVVHPEDGVTWARPHIGHGTSNTIVSIAMRTESVHVS